jgi:hypothetical protein
MAKSRPKDTPPMTFGSILQVDVPRGRDGKHKHILEVLLSDLHHLEDGKALQIPIDSLPDTKENIRSALSRATKQRDINIATSSDENYLYVWKTAEDNHREP